MIHHRDQHGRGANRLLARDDLQHAIGTLIATPRNDVGIDQAWRNVKIQPRAAPIEELRRTDRSWFRLSHRLGQSPPPPSPPSAIAKNSPPNAIPNIWRQRPHRSLL